MNENGCRHRVPFGLLLHYTCSPSCSTYFMKWCTERPNSQVDLSAYQECRNVNLRGLGLFCGFSTHYFCIDFGTKTLPTDSSFHTNFLCWRMASRRIGHGRLGRSGTSYLEVPFPTRHACMLAPAGPDAAAALAPAGPSATLLVGLGLHVG